MTVILIGMLNAGCARIKCGAAPRKMRNCRTRRECSHNVLRSDNVPMLKALRAWQWLETFFVRATNVLMRGSRQLFCAFFFGCGGGTAEMHAEKKACRSKECGMQMQIADRHPRIPSSPFRRVGILVQASACTVSARATRG